MINSHKAFQEGETVVSRGSLAGLAAGTLGSGAGCRNSMCAGRASCRCLSPDVFLAALPTHRAAGPHDATASLLAPHFWTRSLACFSTNLLLDPYMASCAIWCWWGHLRVNMATGLSPQAVSSQGFHSWLSLQLAAC